MSSFLHPQSGDKSKNITQEYCRTEDLGGEAQCDAAIEELKAKKGTGAYIEPRQMKKGLRTVSHQSSARGSKAGQRSFLFSYRLTQLKSRVNFAAFW